MAGILIPSQWRQQPQVPVVVDRAKWPTLVLAAIPALSLKNLAYNTLPTVVGTAPTLREVLASSDGLNLLFHPSGGSSGYPGLRYGDETITSSPDFSFIWVGRLENVDGVNSQLLGRGSDASGGWNANLKITSTSIVGDIVDSSPAQFTVTQTGMSFAAGQLERFAFVKKGAVAKVFHWKTKSMTSGACGNGLLRASAWGMRFGLNDQGVAASHERVTAALGFNSGLNDTQIWELLSNPWQAFQAPARRIWVSAGAPAGATYNVSIAEVASAVDALSAILAGLASIAETGTASDASSAALIGTAAVAEAGTATDSQAASAVFVATRSDALAAADTTSTGGAITSAAVAETAAATDSTSAIATFLASVAEIGAAVDSQSATAVLNAAWSDALNAADSQNWGGSVISVSLSEALNALDSQSASAVFAASVTESGAALDSTSCVLIANASIAEVLAALDSSSVRLITSASIAEALSALDTTSIVNLNFIAAASHILAGRERVTVLVGKSRVLVIY